MAKASFTMHDGEQVVIEPIENLSMHAPYWVVQYDGKRRFVHFDIAKDVVVEGEEELIQAAKARVNNPEQLAKDLGIE